MSTPRIAVVGATGLVGREALAILAERGVPANSVVALASPRSAGTRLPYGGAALSVEALDHTRLGSCEAALFCASAEIAREYAPAAASAGAFVVDNSSAYRMDPGVPLVIPEVNGQLLETYPEARVVANPNCSTILLLSALEPFRREPGIRRVTVSTYQAVSGAGAAALEHLRGLSSEELDVVPHESPVEGDSGLNGEERKMIAETRRIWGRPDFELSPTCIRVPVERAHSQSVVVELAGAPDVALTVDKIRGRIRNSPWLELIDDRERGDFPTPRRATGHDRVLVGRCRLTEVGGRWNLSLWICGDQLRKGAALNAVQILERCFTLPRAGANHGTARVAKPRPPSPIRA